MNSGYHIPKQSVELSARFLREKPHAAVRLLRLGLDFGDRDALAVAHEALAACGHGSPEQARPHFSLPGERMLASPWRDHGGGRPTAGCSAAEVLQQALALGLCTACQYDPSRPVLWTRASLARHVELVPLEGFY